MSRSLKKKGKLGLGAGIKLVTFLIYQVEYYDFTKSNIYKITGSILVGGLKFLPLFCLITTFGSIPYLLIAVQQL